MDYSGMLLPDRWSLFRLNIHIPVRATLPSFVVRTGLTGAREPGSGRDRNNLHLIQDESLSVIRRSAKKTIK